MPRAGSQRAGLFMSSSRPTSDHSSVAAEAESTAIERSAPQQSSSPRPPNNAAYRPLEAKIAHEYISAVA
jgi:hypothetical protein